MTILDLDQKEALVQGPQPAINQSIEELSKSWGTPTRLLFVDEHS